MALYEQFKDLDKEVLLNKIVTYLKIQWQSSKTYAVIKYLRNQIVDFKLICEFIYANYCNNKQIKIIIICLLLLDFLLFYKKEQDVFYMLFGVLLSSFVTIFIVEPLKKSQQEKMYLNITIQIIDLTRIIVFEFFKLKNHICNALKTNNACFDFEEAIQILKGLDKDLSENPLLNRTKSLLPFLVVMNNCSDKIIKYLSSIPYDLRISDYRFILEEICSSMNATKNCAENLTSVINVIEFNSELKELLEKLIRYFKMLNQDALIRSIYLPHMHHLFYNSSEERNI